MLTELFSSTYTTFNRITLLTKLSTVQRFPAVHCRMQVKNRLLWYQNKSHEITRQFLVLTNNCQVQHLVSNFGDSTLSDSDLQVERDQITCSFHVILRNTAWKQYNGAYQMIHCWVPLTGGESNDWNKADTCMCSQKNKQYPRKNLYHGICREWNFNYIINIMHST